MTHHVNLLSFQYAVNFGARFLLVQLIQLDDT